MLRQVVKERETKVAGSALPCVLWRPPSSGQPVHTAALIGHSEAAINFFHPETDAAAVSFQVVEGIEVGPNDDPHMVIRLDPQLSLLGGYVDDDGSAVALVLHGDGSRVKAWRATPTGHDSKVLWSTPAGPDDDS
jgi:hypothetical protein